MKQYEIGIKTPGHTITYRCWAESEAEADAKAKEFAKRHLARMDDRGLLYTALNGQVTFRKPH